MRFRLLFALLFVPCLSARAQSLSFLSYSVAEGLPQSQVWCVFSDSRGYLWFGTQGGGICRYDGRDFTTFNTGDGLPSNFIHSIYQDKEYGLLIGTNRGLCRFNGRQFTAVQGSKAQINAIIKRPDGSIWAGTNNGVYVLKPGSQLLEKESLLPTLDQSAVYAFYPSPEGTWIAGDKGLWLSGRQTRHFSGKFQTQATNSIASDGKNRLWLGSWGTGITIANATTGTPEEVLNDPLLARPLCIFGPVDGAMWIGTQDKGLIIADIESRKLTQISEKNGLPHNHIRSITADRNGRCWIATSGGGVARRLQQNFRHYNREDGLAGNRVYAVFDDKQGRIWFSTSLNGVQMLDSAGFHHPIPDTIFPNTKCKSICEDPRGRLWIGTEGKGLAVVDSNGVQYFNNRNGLLSDWIQRIVCDQDGTIWVAAAGITAFNTSRDSIFTLKTYGAKEGIPDLYVSTLTLDRENRVWFGTQTGRVGCISKGKVMWLSGQAAGLPAVPVRSMAFDLKGRLWVGTKGNGIWVSNNTGPDMIFRQPELSKKSGIQNIYLLICDPGGRIWAGTETGVDKITLAADGSLRDIRHYGKKEGFLGIETCQDAAICDPEGRLWFGTMDGLTRYTPGEETATQAVPVMHFEDISLFYKPLSKTAYAAFCEPGGGLLPGLELPYGQNHLSFAFKAVELEHPEQLRYRWKLLGAEEEWSPGANQESVNYANLNPGKYSFQVQAAAGNGNWSPSLQASFTILEPFWQKLWFRASVLAIIILLIGLIAWLYVRRIKKREAARREQLEVQNHVLQLEQKALQLQMNPHFVFNALTSIQSLITEKDFGMARQQINEFARLMRSILYNSRRQNISLREEVDTLEQYLRIEQFCHQQQFDFTIHLPKELNSEELELPPMLLQPFVENAVVHGVSHLPYQGKIEIDFQLRQEILECRIRDNGVGREQAARLREEKKPGHQSVAMEVTRERLEALRGRQPYNPLEIKDVVNPDGSIGGTEVIVRLPAISEF